LGAFPSPNSRSTDSKVAFNETSSKKVFRSPLVYISGSGMHPVDEATEGVMRKLEIALASLLILLLLVLATPVIAQTQSITIGKFTYLGTVLQSGAVQSVYEIALDATAVTPNPIAFGNAIVIVKGGSFSSQQGNFPIITTGPGCGNPPYQTSCEMRFQGGVGYKIPSCARYNAIKNVFTQNCVSVTLQLVSQTKKNFSFPLLDGTQFCAYGINNIFVEAQPGYKALEPQCDINGFCVGASAPIVLQSAPAESCS
jgi:hypothetical protein